ncbi:MAG: 4-(cytidine 5'-diphospho)-2-C-methyl-D-erythritol kinase [bacterium]
MRLRAFAKINLSLKILGLRPDGFHEIESLMQSVSLHDVITISPISSGIEVTCDNPMVPVGPENLVYKAAKLAGADGIKIHIEKHIPMAAGLAGGSADAAAVLFALKADPQIAAQVGSDVPFCLVGGTCLVKGRGEIVKPHNPNPRTSYIIVTPDLEVSTKWAYDEFDRMGLGSIKIVKNDLELVAVMRYPEITDIETKLLQLGCSHAQMSGSGPSVFGVCKPEQGERILAEVKKKFAQSFLVEPVKKGVEII